MALVIAVIGGVFRNAARDRESSREGPVEIAQSIHPGKRPTAVGVHQTAAPTDPVPGPPVRAVQLERQRIVPSLPVVARIDEVAESVRADVEARTATARRIEADILPVVRKQVSAALALIGQ